jgi:ATP-dependent Lhr-like helicase
MRRVYAGDAVPVVLDATGRGVLVRARAAYRTLGLAETAFNVHGADVSLLPYVGTLRLRALALALQSEGLPAAALPYHVEIRRTAAGDVAAALDAIVRRPPGGLDLVPGAVPEGKFDGCLDPAFRAAWWSEVHGIDALARDTARLILAGRCPRAARRRPA